MCKHLINKEEKDEKILWLISTSKRNVETVIVISYMTRYHSGNGSLGVVFNPVTLSDSFESLTILVSTQPGETGKEGSHQRSQDPRKVPSDFPSLVFGTRYLEDYTCKYLSGRERYDTHPRPHVTVILHHLCTDVGIGRSSRNND